MSVEDKITDEDLINPRCSFNNELRFRAREKIKGSYTGKQYCLIADDLCPFYKQEGHIDKCMNYDTRYK